MSDASPPLFGPSYPLRGVSFLFRHPSLWRFVALPTVVAILLYGLAAWFFIHGLSTWAERFAHEGQTWYGEVLQHLFLAVLSLAFLIFTVYTYALVGALLFAPFADGFSARVEELVTGRRETGPGIHGLPSRLLDRVRLGGQASPPLFHGILSAPDPSSPPRPRAGPLYDPGAPLHDVLPRLGVLRLSDGPPRATTSRRKLKAVTRNFAGVLGFGAGAWLLLIVPLAGLLAIPACVAGSTIYFCELREAGRLPAPPGGVSASSLPEKPA